MEEGQKNSAVWYTVGAIVLIIVAYLVFFKNPTESVAPIIDNATSTNQAANSNAAVTLVVNDQFGTKTTIVDKVVTAAPVWVAVHEDRGGKPGNVLGAAWVPAGESLNVSVGLLREAVEGQTYYVMIHAEDGMAGFDFKTDLPLTDDEANPVMESYKVIFDKG